MEQDWHFLDGWDIVKNDFDDLPEEGDHPTEDILFIRKNDISLDLGWYGGSEGQYCICFFKGTWLCGELLEKFSSNDKSEIFQKIRELVLQYESGAFNTLNGLKVGDKDSENIEGFLALTDFCLRSPNLMSQKIKISGVDETAGLVIIQVLAQEIWTHHYTPIIGAKQVAYMLERFQSVKAMQKQLQEGYRYYLVYDGDEAVGYFSFLHEEQSLFLSKIYVLAERRGRGFGKKAMKFISEQAIQSGLTSIRLTVNKYNTHSIEAYLKMGFVKTRAVVFDIGEGFIMDDYEMEKELKS